jgi:hypothetical protein
VTAFGLRSGNRRRRHRQVNRCRHVKAQLLGGPANNGFGEAWRQSGSVLQRRACLGILDQRSAAANALRNGNNDTPASVTWRPATCGPNHTGFMLCSGHRLQPALEQIRNCTPDRRWPPDPTRLLKCRTKSKAPRSGVLLTSPATRSFTRGARARSAGGPRRCARAPAIIDRPVAAHPPTHVVVRRHRHFSGDLRSLFVIHRELKQQPIWILQVK